MELKDSGAMLRTGCIPSAAYPEKTPPLNGRNLLMLQSQARGPLSLDFYILWEASTDEAREILIRF